jgi:predicted enzyme related to lactoylglutathione lyase
MAIEYPPGTPSWCDLNTPDVDASVSFYGGLFGWQAQDLGPEAGGYRMFTLDGVPVAGVGPLQENSGPPHWMTYMATDDADATAKAVDGAGGKVYLEPMDVLDAGRMAIFTDPGGAFFAAWQPNRHRAAQVVNRPGAMSWNELDTRDAEGARGFYGEVFGWDAEPIEYEGAIAYYTWKLGGRTIGGMLPMGDQFPPDVPPNWVVYFGIEDMAHAIGKLQQLGGGMLMPEREMPNGKFSVARDPHGAVFALWEGSYDDPPGA